MSKKRKRDGDNTSKSEKATSTTSDRKDDSDTGKSATRTKPQKSVQSSKRSDKSEKRDVDTPKGQKTVGFAELADSQSEQSVESDDTGSDSDQDAMEVDKKLTAEQPKQEKSKRPLDEQSSGHISILSKFAKYRADILGRKVEAEEEPELETELQGLHPLPQPVQVEAPKVDPNSVLPKYLSQPTTVPTDNRPSFASFNIPSHLQDQLSKHGITHSFPVQSALLPVLLPSSSDRLSTPQTDVLVSAPTGSGKTLSYLLPIISSLLNRTVPRTYALIIVPTHELASQVQKTAQQLASGTALKVGSAIGSRSFESEKDYIVANDIGSTGADILVATPGRLVEHIRNNPGFTLRYLRWLVVDEADRLLNQSFQDWLEVLADELERPFSNTSSAVNPTAKAIGFDITSMGLRTQQCPADVVRKVILSATMTRDVGKLAGLKLRRPQLIVVDDIGGTEVPIGDGEEDAKMEDAESDPKLKDLNSLPSTLEEQYYPISNPAQKPLVLFKLLSASKITSGILIFAKSNEAAARLGRLLSILSDSFKPAKKSRKDKSTRKQWNIAVSTSDKRKKDIAANTARFKSTAIDILISTDLLSRGVDLPNAHLVINYDAPRNERDYIHRVGRTARAGNSGDAWSLVEDGEARWWWKKIGEIRRSNGDGIRRKVAPTIDENEAKTYESALEKLGNEVRGV